jgi:hypothetical protein
MPGHPDFEDSIIDVRLASDLHFWSIRLGVTEDQIKQAVSKVGVSAKAVAMELGASTLRGASGGPETNSKEPMSQATPAFARTVPDPRR